VYDLSAAGTGLGSGGAYSQHTLGADVADVGIVSARAWDDGLVVLTGALQFVELRGWAGGRVTQLAGPGLADAPGAWAAVPPDSTGSGHVEVVVASGQTVLSVDAIERVDQRLAKGPFTHIAISPNGRFFALVTALGLLWVVSSDFARNLSEVDITKFADAGEMPDRVEWCGDNAVVLTFGSRVVVVGPGGDALQYMYDGAAVLAGEVDGLRIITAQTCEVLQKVPGEFEPPSQLLSHTQTQHWPSSSPAQNTPAQCSTTPSTTLSESRPRPTRRSAPSGRTWRVRSIHALKQLVASGIHSGSEDF
jgi:hypothetical protein